MQMKKNIALVGFMGSGKSAVGKALSRKLGMIFVDSDEAIVEKERRSINDIFAKEGEPYFRKVEKEVIKEISQREGLVIACGGGVVLDKDNMANLKRNGVVVYLEVSPEVIFERTKNYTHRPLLNVDNPKKQIEDILRARIPFYSQADYAIDTSKSTIDEVVDKILEILRT